MEKFRKKPVVIEAYQTDKELDIPTLEGIMHANIGDWIITGVHGEQYPCKPDIFWETYERVGLYDETLPSSETAQWMLRLKDAGIPVVNIDDITLLRRYHRNNFGRRDRKTQLQSYMAIIRQRRARGGK